jgi:hypothetical protein
MNIEQQSESNSNSSYKNGRVIVDLKNSTPSKSGNSPENNPKKRRGGEISIEDEINFIKKGKIEKGGNIYEDEKSSNTNNPTNEDDLNGNLNSQIYGFISKNDMLKLIWKMEIPIDELFQSAPISYSESYLSKRNDNWKLQVIHQNAGRNGGKMSVMVSCERAESLVKSDKEGELSFVEEVFNSITFEVDYSLQIIGFKNHSARLKNIKHNYPEIKEFNLPQEFYSTLSKSKMEYFTMILDVEITKCYESICNQERNKLGYIGIINEASTCYMNSMLQTLNIIGTFKKAVFQIPTKDENYNSVALSLQRIFYDLMKDTNPISTNRLVKSFGWGRAQMEIQHDVQEFNLLLSDVME